MLASTDTKCYELINNTVGIVQLVDLDPFKSTSLARARFISTKLLTQRDFLLYWDQVRYIVLGTRSPAVNNFAAHNCSWSPNSRQSRRPETYCLGRGIFGSFGPHGKTTMGMSASGRKWIQSYVFLPSQVDAVSHMKVCSNQQHPDQPSCMSLLLLEEDLDCTLQRLHVGQCRRRRLRSCHSTCQRQIRHARRKSTSATQYGLCSTGRNRSDSRTPRGKRSRRVLPAQPGERGKDHRVALAGSPNEDLRSYSGPNVGAARHRLVKRPI